MSIKNTSSHFGGVTMLLHWVTALLIICLLCLGLYMTSMEFTPQTLKMYGLHKSFGVLVLFLVFIRLFWRYINILPKLPSEMKPIEVFLARSMHIFLYMLMFAMPVSGWFMSSASGFPVSFFGLFLMPDFVPSSEYLKEIFENIHKICAYTLIAAICGHVSAALFHHFFRKDDVLLTMLPKNFTKKNDKK